MAQKNSEMSPPQPRNTKMSEKEQVSMTARIEKQLKMEKSEIKKTHKVVAEKEKPIKQLEDFYTEEICRLEEFRKNLEKTSADAETQFAEAIKTKEELFAVIENLTHDTFKSELAKVEEVLNQHLSYKNLLSNLSVSQWQETQEAETLKVKVLNNEDDQTEINPELRNTAASKGLERDVESSPGQALPSTNDPTLSSADSDTIVTDSTLDVNSTGYEEKLELHFSEPEQLLDLLADLTHQNLSQIQNSTGVDKNLVQTIEITTERMKEDEERLMCQVDVMKDKIVKQQARDDMFRLQVQLHDPLKTQDKDIMLNSVDRTVTKVYLRCVGSRMAYMNTTKKLVSVEYRLSLVLQQIECIPEDMLKKLRHIKDIEKRASLREEMLRLEMEERRKRTEKCSQRVMSEAKRITGRRLMPRCFPVQQHDEVTEGAPVSPEEDLQAYLFSED